jgi:hypothetical protein
LALLTSFSPLLLRQSWSEANPPLLTQVPVPIRPPWAPTHSIVDSRALTRPWPQADGFVASLHEAKCDRPAASGATTSEAQAAETLSASTLPPRPDLDLTEKLWNFVKEATSFQDLRQSLAFLLTALRKGQINHPINRGNSTAVWRTCEPALVPGVLCFS